MPIAALEMRAQFREHVIERFAASYLGGETPNPCVWCNQRIKFGELIDYAAKRGFSYVATGHYARVEHDRASGRFLLKKGVDGEKDQSYMLYTLTQEQLKRVLFPLGALSKSEVRKIAASNGFPNAQKRESQDICFVQSGDYAGFIEAFTGKPMERGPIFDEKGAAVGLHGGAVRYTIGQRKGLGLAMPEPVYVYAKSMVENKLYVGGEALLYSKTLIARDINLIPFQSLAAPLRVTAKTRYRQRERPARIEQTSGDEILVEFDEPQRAVTAGQSVVFYDGDTVVGGGIIQ
jgi:tRNA-specific 2-thiouridylase